MILSNSSLNALHKPLIALYLSVARFFVFYVPLAWLGPRLARREGRFLESLAASGRVPRVYRQIRDPQGRLLRHAVGLPETFAGVIQDSASSATLAAVLTMRERALNWQGNAAGLSGQPRLRIYCSPEAHSSIDRAIWVAGIGQENLVRVPLAPGPMRAMCPNALAAAIGSAIMGLWGKLPIAQAPGMGLNAFFAYTVVLGLGIPW
ncbi:MAG: hypothetical protein EBS68_18165, partial [Rhodobacteraceae bacterium]|nr:hypothetical protein [Paracoccaceae bacterium]